MTENELYHHGIIGQKWGVRRFQNPDGSLTEAGKKRYAKELYGALNRTDKYGQLKKSAATKLSNDSRFMKYAKEAKRLEDEWFNESNKFDQQSEKFFSSKEYYETLDNPKYKDNDSWIDDVYMKWALDNTNFKKLSDITNEKAKFYEKATSELLGKYADSKPKKGYGNMSNRLSSELKKLSYGKDTVETYRNKSTGNSIIITKKR